MNKLHKISVFLVMLVATGIGFWYLSHSAAPILTSSARVTALSDEIYAVYVDFENKGKADKILEISSNSDATVSIMGVPAGFSPVIPQNSKASFSPDGAHIMLHSMGTELPSGTLMTFNIVFEHAGTLPFKAVIGDSKLSGQQMDMNSGDTSEKPAMDHSMHNMNSALVIENPDQVPKIDMTVTEKNDGRYSILLSTENFEFVEPVNDPSQHVDGQGHGHLYLNGLKIQRMYQDNAELGILPSGRHRVTVSLNTNDHRNYSHSGRIIKADFDIEVTQ